MAKWCAEFVEEMKREFGHPSDIFDADKALRAAAVIRKMLEESIPPSEPR